MLDDDLQMDFTNKQPRIQQTEYHHWIRLTIYSTMGRNEYNRSGHLSIFTYLKHLMVFWGAFFRDSMLYLIKDTDSMYRDMQLNFVLQYL